MVGLAVSITDLSRLLDLDPCLSLLLCWIRARLIFPYPGYLYHHQAMYWLQYLALSSGAAILAHAGSVQKEDGAQDSGPITTTVNVKGTLMTLTVMGSPVTPTAEARVDPAPSTDSRTDLLADDATFWDWSDNYRKTPAQGPHQKSEVELYAQEMLGWEEDMQCGSADGDCVNLPTYEHINEKVRNDTLAGRIYFSMVSANNINACRRMFNVSPPKSTRGVPVHCETELTSRTEWWAQSQETRWSVPARRGPSAAAPR